MKGRGIIVMLGALAVTAALVGCDSSGDSGGSANQASVDDTPDSAPRPSVRFVTPKDGVTTGGTVKARVALENFQIAPNAVGQAPRPGQGHLHFQMDGGTYDRPRYSGPNGEMGKKLGVTGHYSPALSPEITYRHLPRGEHELEVYLANNNHTNVGVEAKVEFTVARGS